MKRLKVGVVGLGIGRTHVRAYQALEDRFEVAALCDSDPERRAARSAELGVERAVADLDALLDIDLDVIDICSPPHLHFEMIRAALAARRHVICEKPLVTSLAAADELIELANAGDRLCMPISQYRFGAGLQKLAHLVAAGVTGTPYVATIETHWRRGDHYYSVPWRGRWATEYGGVLLGHALHAHDLLCFVLGDIASVGCRVATRVNPIETEDCASLSLEMTNGALVTSSATLGSMVEESRLRFCFERLTAESSLEPYDPGAEPWTFTPADDEAGLAIESALADFSAPASGFEGQFAAFFEAVTRGAPLPMTLRDARRGLELVTAAYASAREDRIVRLPLGPGASGYHDWRPADATSGAPDSE